MGAGPARSHHAPEGAVGTEEGPFGRVPGPGVAERLHRTERAQGRHGRRSLTWVSVGDWWCCRCRDLVFARNDACRRCRVPVPPEQYRINWEGYATIDPDERYWGVTIPS